MGSVLILTFVISISSSESESLSYNNWLLRSEVTEPVDGEEELENLGSTFILTSMISISLSESEESLSVENSRLIPELASRVVGEDEKDVGSILIPPLSLSEYGGGGEEKTAGEDGASALVSMLATIVEEAVDSEVGTRVAFVRSADLLALKHGAVFVGGWSFAPTDQRVGGPGCDTLMRCDGTKVGCSISSSAATISWEQGSKNIESKSSSSSSPVAGAPELGGAAQKLEGKASSARSSSVRKSSE
ncbi:hypothetical protein FB451DRAFT_1278468 [Mycena latifolia]|nr:hypothetical protein FB451DRAFT_1278468 [Mycena latifolia]